VDGKRVTATAFARDAQAVEAAVLVQILNGQTAGGEGRTVPLSETALQSIQDWRRQFPEANPDHLLIDPS